MHWCSIAFFGAFISLGCGSTADGMGGDTGTEASDGGTTSTSSSDGNSTSTSRGATTSSAGEDEGGDQTSTGGGPSAPIWAVDVLLVVDNSASMSEEQTRLATAVGPLADTFAEHDLDFRIGVTTTDNGNIYCNATGPEGGALVLSSCKERIGDFLFAPGTAIEADARAACNDVCTLATLTTVPTEIPGDSTPKIRPWIEVVDGASNLADGASVIDALHCLVPQGINGCGFEQHFESMYKAYQRWSDPEQASFGFLRDDSILLVVLASDEDDCSTNQDYDADVWGQSGSHVFWEDPMADYPTSAVCWNAGVACTGGPGTYEDCQPENHDAEGNPGAADDVAVMRPMSRYTSFLQALEDQRREIAGQQEVLVAVLSGVPIDYPDTAIVYRDAEVMEDQLDFGIGFGCETADGRAVPPVRLRALADAFAVEDDHRGLYSICAEDYGPGFSALADLVIARLGR